MAQRRLSMRSVHEVLRLRHKLGRSLRDIAAAVGIPLSTVSTYLRRAEAAGISWPLPEEMDDAALEAALFPPRASSSEPRPEPEWAGIHRQLTGKGEGKGKRIEGMTPRTLWLEYLENNPGGYRYSRLCKPPAAMGVEGYAFMKANRAIFPLAPVCRMPGLSTTGYSGWPRRRPSARERRDAEIRCEIGRIWRESDETCGCPRIHAAVQHEGERVIRKRAALDRRRNVLRTVPTLCRTLRRQDRGGRLRCGLPAGYRLRRGGGYRNAGPTGRLVAGNGISEGRRARATGVRDVGEGSGARRGRDAVDARDQVWERDRSALGSGGLPGRLGGLASCGPRSGGQPGEGGSGRTDTG